MPTSFLLSDRTESTRVREPGCLATAWPASRQHNQTPGVLLSTTSSGVFTTAAPRDLICTSHSVASTSLVAPISSVSVSAPNFTNACSDSSIIVSSSTSGISGVICYMLNNWVFKLLFRGLFD
ncbi:unnamed protein product [Protopolystoma xenopodis]|uniref:Uncharacterized protein n=1 Tax=Protopolystoma xenopodis TaxID=117903 RepID=A0A3S5CNW2_9PLAT|nr:unnamed protein product [Protopolystoma xenopodis]